MKTLQIPVFCTATCGIFSSNPRRIHSGKKDKEKEEYGLLIAMSCYDFAIVLKPRFKIDVVVVVI
jgi:hypothetical protein